MVTNVPSGMLGGTNHSTALSLASRRFQTLCSAAGFDAATGRVAANMFDNLVLPELDVSGEGWESEVSDEGFPLEFSVALANGQCDVRVLFEPRAPEPTVSAHREAALRFHERIAQQVGVDLSRFKLVEDLFLPAGMQGSFAAWSSIVFHGDGTLAFKVYFNPQARGIAQSYALADEALCRLGFEHAWHGLARHGARRGPYLDEVKYFAMDLSSSPDARVKVYVRHHAATPGDLEVASSGPRDYQPGQALRFITAMCGHTARLALRPAFTCSAFTSQHSEQPDATTLYVPVCAYARHDAEVRERIAAYLDGENADRYTRLIDTYASRPLNSGVGLQSWAALRELDGKSRLTLYLSAELRRVYPPSSVPAASPDRSSLGSHEAIVQMLLAYPLMAHPFVERLKREDAHAGFLWLLVMNLYEGTSKHFVKWLATVTANFDDDRVRSLLARQLDQELGEGDVSRAHSNLMREFLEAISVLRPAGFHDEQLQIGRRLGDQLAQHYMSRDPYEGLAALMAGEICAEQLIGTVSELLRKQPGPLDSSKLDWLLAHDELEESHAQESFVMARMLSDSSDCIRSVQRGAWGVHHALWTALDALHELCFGS